MNASMIYVGDRLKLYSYLREACQKPGSYVTAIELAEVTVSLLCRLLNYFLRFSLAIINLSINLFVGLGLESKMVARMACSPSGHGNDQVASWNRR